MRKAQPKLLLVAMSGVRVQDAELRRLGLSLPGFIERGRVIASLPSLGLLSLAAHTPPQWDVRYLEIDDLDEAVHVQVLDGGFDLVAISSLSARVLDAYALADKWRAAGVTVILGGLHATVLSHEAAAHADAVVQGEGEAVWPQLLADFSNGVLKPFYTSFGHPHDLRRSRAPRYDLLDIAKYNRLTLQTTRGCPLACHFCGASRLLSAWKTKPLDLVRRDLEAILAVWPRPFLELADDNSFADKVWGRDWRACWASSIARGFPRPTSRSPTTPRCWSCSRSRTAPSFSLAWSRRAPPRCAGSTAPTGRAAAPMAT